MATKYLLPCECGKSVPVDVGQSGLTISCDCGASLQVPTLQGLKRLPLAEIDAPAPKPSWGRRQGRTLLGALIAVIGFAAAVTQSQAPKLGWPEVPEMPPKVALDTWNSFKEHGLSAGLGDFERYREDIIRRRRLTTEQKAWIVIYALIGVAGLVLASVARFVLPDTDRSPRRRPS